MRVIYTCHGPNMTTCFCVQAEFRNPEDYTLTPVASWGVPRASNNLLEDSEDSLKAVIPKAMLLYGKVTE